MVQKKMRRILVTGASGQIGSELTPMLREEYGTCSVVASDIKQPNDSMILEGPFELLDVTDLNAMKRVVERYSIDSIFHLAAILSASGEQRPQTAWHVNMNGLYNVLETAREMNLTRVFNPSSIAAFGPETPRDMTPQETIMRPRTIYGVTKVSGELLCNYYNQKFGVDVRGIRYPGVISSKTLPGGGTTDYAVEIFYEATKNRRYTCYLREDTILPMIYMPDCLRAACQLMEVDLSKLRHHADYNVAALSFSPAELSAEIKKHIPEFTVEYRPDFRQSIADSWPCSIDDSAAREEWGWKPEFSVSAMTTDMLEKLERKLG